VRCGGGEVWRCSGRVGPTLVNVRGEGQLVGCLVRQWWVWRGGGVVVS